jgi:hypothetical protein
MDVQVLLCFSRQTVKLGGFFIPWDLQEATVSKGCP